jgi:sporulation protein YlmC with PRC-barrel domain
MRRTNGIWSAAALIALCGSAVLAQPAEETRRDTGNDRTMDRGTDPNGTNNANNENATSARRVALVPTEWVIGQKILDKDRRRLGSVKDLVLDAKDGHVVYALVNRAPKPDASPAIVAVPWLALDWDSAERAMVLPVSRDRLAEAKMFDVKRWDVLNDTTWTDETYNYFNVKRDSYDLGWGYDQADAHPSPEDHQEVLDQREGNRPTDQNRPADTHRDSNGNNDPNQTRSADGAQDTGRPGPGSMADDRMGGPRKYVLASKVEGQTLRGAEDKEIGDVEDLVFDASSGRMAFIVAEFGGFLGIGDSKVAVPWDYFKVNDEGHLYTNEVKAEEVRTAPRIERADWSELRDPEYGPRVYKHFGRDATWFQSGFGGQAEGQSGGQMGYDDNQWSTGTDTDASGTVSRMTDENGMQTIVVRTNSGDRLVRLAPASYLEKQGWKAREGDQVTIKGRMVTIDGKQVLLASSIQGADNKTVELRDNSGQPSWRGVR